jgi:hypothetical protein
MRPFGILRIAVTVLGFGAVLVLTPSCRAQSEINPDHFDGTDSWAVAAKTPTPQRLHYRAAQNPQAQNKLTGGSSTVQLAAERHFSAPVAIQDKRKLAVRKNERQ